MEIGAYGSRLPFISGTALNLFDIVKGVNYVSSYLIFKPLYSGNYESGEEKVETSGKEEDKLYFFHLHTLM